MADYVWFEARLDKDLAFALDKVCKAYDKKQNARWDALRAWLEANPSFCAISPEELLEKMDELDG